MQRSRGKGGIGLLPGDAASFKLISGTLGHLAGEMLDVPPPSRALAAWHPDGLAARRAV